MISERRDADFEGLVIGCFDPIPDGETEAVPDPVEWIVAADIQNRGDWRRLPKVDLNPFDRVLFFINVAVVTEFRLRTSSSFLLLLQFDQPGVNRGQLFASSLSDDDVQSSLLLNQRFFASDQFPTTGRRLRIGVVHPIGSVECGED